jgi:antitoxin VapB
MGAQQAGQVKDSGSIVAQAQQGEAGEPTIAHHRIAGDLGCILVGGDGMSDVGVARIFRHGRSQAVRLPLAFRLSGDRARLRRIERGILLEPIMSNIDAWFALDGLADVPFMEEGRRQPPTPAAEDLCV